MRYFILASGAGSRWNRHLGIDKCLISIDGELLLDRVVGLLEDSGVPGDNITLCGNEEIRDKIYLDEQIHPAADADFCFLNAKTKREAFLEVALKEQGAFVILFGDTYYTKEIINDIVNRSVEKWAHWCNPNPNKYTGCPWSEGYCHKVSDWQWWITYMKEYNARVEAGEIDDNRDYAINNFLENRPMEMIYFHDFSYMNEHDIYWQDTTDDFDFPEDYERFKENYRKAKDIKLSVVIPIYNTSKWCEPLVKTLTMQQLTCKETEIILIDDGSTEDTHWMNTLGVTVIHKANGGVSSARNIGMSAAIGEYVTFVDSDDELSPNFLSDILEEIDADNPADVIDFKAKCEDGSDMHHWGTVWAKAFKRSFIIDTPFCELVNTGEDGKWYNAIMSKEHSMKKVNKTIYYYRWSANPDSLCKRVNRGDLGKEK